MDTWGEPLDLDNGPSDAELEDEAYWAEVARLEALDAAIEQEDD